MVPLRAVRRANGPPEVATNGMWFRCGPSDDLTKLSVVILPKTASLECSTKLRHLIFPGRIWPRFGANSVSEFRQISDPRILSQIASVRFISVGTRRDGEQERDKASGGGTGGKRRNKSARADRDTKRG